MDERMEIGKLSSNQVKYLTLLDEFEKKKMVQKRGIVQLIADRGFERMAKIVHNQEESYLELTVKEMHAMSRVDGRDMAGHLASLKYLSHGSLKMAEIKDGKVRIPLNVCTYEIYDHGIIWGNVSITVACSVGAAHMPESTARLIFIL